MIHCTTDLLLLARNTCSGRTADLNVSKIGAVTAAVGKEFQIDTVLGQNER
ncbi:hypothetical protein DPMN_159145 [Dreissena polymorpha]|uniref:Uncharacterized protein n=1 Tax=Dreissena polymorpha TaxID=45954 RepID=A0A9D4EL54_DREPO|nr:hypothetical protein DPMN_159145 [Dreissena polymorpha]